LNKVQFDSMTFQERNGTCGIKPQRSGQNLAEKSRTNWDLKWDENYFVLFHFLNWYGIFRSFQTERNEINNLGSTYLVFSSVISSKGCRFWHLQKFLLIIVKITFKNKYSLFLCLKKYFFKKIIFFMFLF